MDETKAIETLWWNLMSYALSKKLTLKLEKTTGFTGDFVLYASIFPVEFSPKCLKSEYGRACEISLFLDFEKFIKEYDPLNK